jgi:hypothetical protein
VVAVPAAVVATVTLVLAQLQVAALAAHGTAILPAVQEAQAVVVEIVAMVLLVIDLEYQAGLALLDKGFQVAAVLDLMMTAKTHTMAVVVAVLEVRD